MLIRSLLVSAALAFPAAAQEASTYDAHSAIFNAGAQDFIGITVQACTEDGKSVEVTMNPVAHKNAISKGLAEQGQAFRDAANGAVNSMGADLRGTVAEIDSSALKGLSRFGQEQQIAPLMEGMAANGFPIPVNGMRIYSRLGGTGCLIA